jgi:PAS domain S-box-containing protein
MFRTFFEQNSVGFAMINTDGTWLRFNDKLCEMTGYSREELHGVHWRDFTPTEDQQRERPLLNEVLSGKIDSYTIEKRCIRRDGSTMDISVLTKPLRRPDGEFRCFASIVQDISERKKSERELARHQEAIIGSMAILAERRDHGTGEHIRRTKIYVQRLLELSGGERFYPPEHLPLLAQAAILHDIGKVGVPDSLLLKPGKLTPDEFEVVKRHTVIGGDVLGEAARILGEAPFIHYARQIIEYHHERWDGAGYPHGLKEEEIPFIARIMAIADVYDALVSERPYKGPIPHEEAVRIIVEGSGSHFDPRLVDAFLACADEFKALSRSGG